ncbi:MAG: glycosyltransferase family 39 protein [Anaerolineae bacterium]|nr:glycosyltransferase family 39 protein [Anaerolineae bacterium]
MIRARLRALRRLPDGQIGLILVALAAGVRLLGLGAESLWYDEAFTAWLVGRLDWGAMGQAIAGDVHPPLWYVVERVAVGVLGPSEAALRLPAALFGVFGVWLVWRIARALPFCRAAALGAGLFAAFLPASLYYSQDARMYPMLAAFVLLSLYGLLRERWLLFVLGGIGALYTQNLAVVYLAALGGAALFQHRRRIWPALAALTAIGLAWLPWAAAVIIPQARSVADGYWVQAPTLTDVLLPLMGMTLGWRMHPAIQLQVYGAASVAIVGGLIAARGWLRTREGQLVLACLIAPPLLLALISWLWRPLFLPRALLPSAMLIPLLWAHWLARSSRPNRRAMLAVLVPAVAAGVVAHFFPVFPRENLRDRAAFVAQAAQPGEIVYFTGLHTAISLGYYLPDLPLYVHPDAADLDQTLTERTQAVMGFRRAPLDALARQWRGAWLIVNLTPRTGPAESDAVAAIVARYGPDVAAHWDLSDGALTVYHIRLGE